MQVHRFRSRPGDAEPDRASRGRRSRPAVERPAPAYCTAFDEPLADAATLRATAASAAAPWR